MLHINNPYLYHPLPSVRRAADDICLYIEQHPTWGVLFEQGKMLGILLARVKVSDSMPQAVHPWSDGMVLLVAYSGVVNGLTDPDHYFVPPVYDLSHPDDFYMREDAEISLLNERIAALRSQKGLLEDEQSAGQSGGGRPASIEHQLSQLQQERRERSAALQLKIFSHFDFCNEQGEYRNVVDIFRDAKRGLPPGGTGECAAPRLLQYALQHGLEPVSLAEFWYGRSPSRYRRVHGQFYPSCIEKCSPLLAYMTGQRAAEPPAVDDALQPEVLYDNDRVVVVCKPAGMLSQPAKDLSLPNLEQWLKRRYPDCRLPFMLAHRLDQATSGVLIAAKDAQTHKALQKAFEQKRIRKRYVALLAGTVPSDCGIISLPLCTNPDDRPRQVVDWQFGRESLTRYEVLERRQDGRTLIAFYPLTGRTHQLRLHAASPFGLDCPICGDTLYQEEPTPGRLCLHAEQIIFPDDLAEELGMPKEIRKEGLKEVTGK
ncbi:MAG: RluA family pseudouridine synthase [Bacteroidales bacterium]|nr:RluA family pseudouridine synthase [Bacteroidales bacterium]